MRVIVFGADGFLGSNVCKIIKSDHILGRATKAGGSNANEYKVNLLKIEEVKKSLKIFMPDVVINCAGIVGSSDVVEYNQKFTSNILQAVNELGLELKSVIVLGSAAEYGVVNALPVSEDTPLKGDSVYGLSKIHETSLALEFREKYNIPVIIARIFNPIGAGMNERFLIPSLIRQVNELKSGLRKDIEVTRLDAKRDYLDVTDVAVALKTLAEGMPKQIVYNIGSGKSTTNKELVDIIVSSAKISGLPAISETSKVPEKRIASQADVSRIRNEFNWRPSIKLEETLKEIMYA